ncbi:serine hydrolase [Sorangium sp. So ce233]|uniref:serine hydrolase domain-containing protein n=1 Tax=Sorangium sp. So ce233 TaxID=3133290 RepID=UPI003F634D6B
MPVSAAQGAIVGIGIAGSDDHVYTWYADGKVSSGTSTHFEYYHGKVDYVLPEGKNPWDIVAMAIAGSTDHVYTWYADGTVSEGWSQDLGFYSDPQPFTLPPGYDVSAIVGVGIASDDRVYAFYADGKVSQGWSQDLDFYQAPYAYALPGQKKIGHIIDVEIASSTDAVYAWYHDVELGSGHSTIADQVDARAMDVLRRYRLPGLGVAVSKNGRVVLEKGYGFSDFTTQTRMEPGMRCRMGSVSKVITTLGAMHLDQHRTDFSVSQRVYGATGALPGSSYLAAQDRGVSRHQPIVAKAIAANDHVYTWYHNGTVTEGTSVDPDYYGAPVSYTLAPGMTFEDVRAIAIAPNDWTWFWYEDGTFSAGQTSDADLHVARDPDVKVAVPGHLMSNILDVDFASNGTVYVWYDDGEQSAGTTSDFGATINPRSYTTAPGKSRYDIRGMGIAKSNNHVYTWFSDGTVIEGQSRDLDAYGGPNAYSVPASAFDHSKDWSDWYGDIRVNHLMSHSAGFSGGGDTVATSAMFGLAEDSLSYKQVHEYVLSTRKLLFAPGTSEDYSNHGMGLVGHIVAQVSGMTYHNYIRSNIVDPLGLNIRADSSGQSAQDMFRHSYVGGVPASYLDDATNNLGLAAGGWKASAGDLVRLMLATDGNPNHPDILSPATLALMESRPYPGASSFAHGWDRNSAGKLAHSGRLDGGTTYIAKYPTNYINGSSAPITVAICTNVSISDARGGSGPLATLAGDIAVVVNDATIDAGYDLY